MRLFVISFIVAVGFGGREGALPNRVIQNKGSISLMKLLFYTCSPLNLYIFIYPILLYFLRINSYSFQKQGLKVCLLNS